MSRDRITQLIALVVMIAALFCSGGVGLLLTASAGRHKLVYTDTAEKGQPPQVALGIAMGAFRGVFVNFLWIRANTLKEAGKYHEAIELARAITKLQPRFPRVWIFHAWNMAYNISVTTQTKDERWNWVSQGIRLLRDEGIPANPNDTLIHKELAWIFLHKIQGYTDDFNVYYKSQLAGEWQIVMGDPPRIDPKSRGRDVVIKQYADWLRGFNDAPNTFAELREKNAAAGDLADKVSALLPNRDRFDVLRLYEINRALLKSPTRAAFLKQVREKDPKMADFADLVADPKNKDQWDALTRYLRKRVLTQQYHMEIPRMIRYTEKFGPLDWRHPASHGLYWSTRGVEEGLQRYNNANRLDFDFLNTDRIAIQSLQELWRSGDVYFDFLKAMQKQHAIYLAVPSAYFAESYGDYVETLMDRSWADNPTRVFTSYGAGYENFLKDVIRFFYRRGQLDMANKYYERLRTWGRRNINGSFVDDYSAPLDTFVEKELADRQISPDVALQEISASLMDAFQKGLLQDDSDAYRRCVEYAKRFHRYYFEHQYRKLVGNVVRTEKFPQDFYEIAGVLFEKFIDMVPEEEIARVYGGVDEELQRWAYDKIYAMNFDAYKEIEKNGGKSFAATFPEPPGMAEFRLKRDRILKERASPTEGIQTK